MYELTVKLKITGNNPKDLHKKTQQLRNYLEKSKMAKSISHISLDGVAENPPVREEFINRPLKQIN